MILNQRSEENNERKKLKAINAPAIVSTTRESGLRKYRNDRRDRP